jgi:alginate O-acetyltransferase complex protein AlgJ
MKKAGIRLVVVPVPPKAVVYPDKITDAGAGSEGVPPRLDAAHQEFYALLREGGVEVVDLFPDLAKHRLDREGAMYCRTDTHWSGRACERVAATLANTIKKEPWYGSVAKDDFAAERRDVAVQGDLLRALPEAKRPSGETLPLRFVGRKQAGAPLAPVEDDPNSPVVLMTDSHGLVFHGGRDMHCRGAGLADQLAYELGFPVDVVAARGSAATPVRITFYRNGNKEGYLARKKVVIWCFAAREFTETSGWAKIPVRKSK